MMKALVGYGDKTIEQVKAEQEARSKGKAPKGEKSAPKKAGETKPAPAQLDALNRLLANAKPRPRPAAE